MKVNYEWIKDLVSQLIGAHTNFLLKNKDITNIMVWIKNCQDDYWINIDNVFSISFQQMDKTGKDDWVEFFVRPSNARILQICLEVGQNPNPNPDSDNISWHSLFYDRAMEVTNAIFEAISKAKREDRL